MVLLSELLTIALALLTVTTALFYNVSHVVRKLARRHSVCAESIYSLPITYIACFVLLREESLAGVAAIYLTVVTVNFSYMKLGRWSYKDWVLRITSILLTMSMYIVFFAFVGLSDVKTAADKLTGKVDNPPLPQIWPVEKDLRFFHVFGIFFSSWRFCLINFILILAIFPRKNNIVRVQISEKRKYSIKIWKSVTLWFKLIAVWVILKLSGRAPSPKSPWRDIDMILLDDNDLSRVTFGVVSILMLFDIVSAISYSDEDKLYDWDEWMVSIKKKNGRWKNKFLGLLLAAREDHNNNNNENANIIGGVEQQQDGIENEEEENKYGKASISNLVNNIRTNIASAVAAASEGGASAAHGGATRQPEPVARNVDIP